MSDYLHLYPDIPPVLTPREARAILGIGRTKMYHLLQTGDIKSILVGGEYRIPRIYFLEFLGAGSVQPVANIEGGGINE